MNRTTSHPPESLLRDLRKTGNICDADQFSALKGGRTNQVWKITSGGQERVLKLYRSDQANPMFRNDPQSETICLGKLANWGLAPRLLSSGTHSVGHWIIYSHVDGQVWKADSSPVAQLLARVHRETPPQNIPFGQNGSFQIERQTRDILAKCQSSDRYFLDARIPSGIVPPTQKICLIHGDPVPGNIVVARQGPILIDWQCPAIGDPAEDLALFLSPAMQLLYRNSPLSADEQKSFLSAYPDLEIVKRYQSLKPWYHWRMAAYCLWKIGQADTDYAAGLKLECAQL